MGGAVRNGGGLSRISCNSATENEARASFIRKSLEQRTADVPLNQQWGEIGRSEWFNQIATMITRAQPHDSDFVL